MKLTKLTRQLDSTAPMTVMPFAPRGARCRASAHLGALAFLSLAAGVSCSNTEVSPATFRLTSAMTDTNQAQFAISVGAPPTTRSRRIRPPN